MSVEYHGYFLEDSIQDIFEELVDISCVKINHSIIFSYDELNNKTKINSKYYDENDLSGTYITLPAGWTFDGQGYFIDLNKNTTWNGLIHDEGNDSLDNIIHLKNIGFINGILVHDDTGFLVRHQL